MEGPSVDTEFQTRAAGLPLAPVTTQDESWYELAYQIADPAVRQLILVTHRRLKELESIVTTFEKAYRIGRIVVPIAFSLAGLIAAVVS